MTEFYLRIKGNVWVGVPPSVTNLTTYVLVEQEDWFEKEIGFVRRWLRHGMHALDIGANYGVYALSMAQAVLPNGKVCAFEPTRATSEALGRSIAKNNLDNLQLLPLALSNREGTAVFYTYPNSEMNSLRRVGATDEAMPQEVAVSTIDREFPALGWSTIDFVKIDAEGEEINVINGGRRFFAEQSPLVMFEIPMPRKDGDIIPLLGQFLELGYSIYRLINRDSFLVPMLSGRDVEFFDINLFACKPERAADLAAARLLVRVEDIPTVSPDGNGQALFEHQIYAAAFGALLSADDMYQFALDAYAAWCDSSIPNGARYAALIRALTTAQNAATARPTIARLSTLARIAEDAGERKLALSAIDDLTLKLLDTAQPPDEPFFPPVPRYDGIDPQGATRSWLLAATFEAGERNRFYSGYFQQLTATTLDLHEWLAQTPFASAEMERRRQLLRLFNDKQPKLLAAPILAQVTPDNLNPQFWQQQN